MKSYFMELGNPGKPMSWSPTRWQSEALAAQGSWSSGSAMWFRISFVSWRPKQFVACCQAAKLPSCPSFPLHFTWHVFFFVQGPRILCGASWSAALSEYICSNHVLSPHLDILKGHNLKPYRTDGEANGKKETPSELELEFEFWVRVRHATCNAIQSGKKRNSLAERHPKVAEIELKDNTKCQRRQRRSSTQIADQASGQRIGTSQVVAKRGGAAITFHWAHSDNEPPTHTRKNNWVS